MKCECGAIAGQECKWITSSNGDDCTCNNCNWNGLVVQGCDICPGCKAQGTMKWTNEEELDD